MFLVGILSVKSLHHALALAIRSLNLRIPAFPVNRLQHALNQPLRAVLLVELHNLNLENQNLGVQIHNRTFKLILEARISFVKVNVFDDCVHWQEWSYLGQCTGNEFMLLGVRHAELQDRGDQHSKLAAKANLQNGLIKFPMLQEASESNPQTLRHASKSSRRKS